MNKDKINFLSGVKMKVSVKLVFAIFLVISAGIVGYSYMPSSDEAEIQQEDIKKENVNYDKLDEVVFDVLVQPVEKGTLIKRVKANGLVKAFDEIEIEANTSGYIKNINVYDGKEVKKGELLLKLDDTEKVINLANAEDEIVKSQIEYKFLKGDVTIDAKQLNMAKRIRQEIKNVEERFKNKEITLKKYESLTDSLQTQLIYTGTERDKVVANQSGLNAALNRKKLAELELSYTEIRAPFSGVAGNCDLSVGEKINNGKPVLKLFAMKKLKVEVGVLESEILTVKPGVPARLTFNAIQGKTFEGKVLFVSPFINEESKTCKVTVEVNNEDLLIKPGMFAKVEIETKRLKDRVLIPKKSLLIRDKRPLVFVVEGELAKWKYVDLGEENDEYYEILNDKLKVGESLVVQGHYTLAHDANVNVIK